jgi:hypothetical protein
MKQAGLVLLLLLLPQNALSEVKLAPEVSVSFPQAFQVGVQGFCTEGGWICSPNLSGYFDLGGIYYPMGSNDRSLGVFSLETGARYYFSESHWFGGLALGFRNLGLSADLSSFRIDGEALATQGSIQLSTLYLSPVVGARFSLGNQYLFEFNLGVQVPFYANGFLFLRNDKNGQNSDNSAVLQTDSKVAFSRIAALIVPSFTVFRVVRYF